MESVWSVSKLSTESVGSRCELVANCVHTADADATKQFSSRRRCVLGIKPALTTVANTHSGSIVNSYLFFSIRLWYRYIDSWIITLDTANWGSYHSQI